MKLPDKKFARPALKVGGVILLVVLVAKLLPSHAGTILCLLLLGGYYGLIGRALKFCDINFREILMNDLPRILLVAAVGTGFIVAMINAQQTIYIGDQLETWEPTLSCEELTFIDPYQALKNLRWSINHADYNNFLPMLMSLPMHLFGRSFLCYELYVWLMFGLPGIFFAAAIIQTVLERTGFKNFPCSALMAVILLFPIIEIPIFVGYANISILLPGSIILAMLLSLDKSQLQREPLILIAALCVVAVFQARTAAYMILGMFFGYTVYVAVSGLMERTLLRDLVMLIQKFFCIGVLGFLIMLPLFFSFVKHMLTYDAGTAYSAYTMGLDFPMRVFAHANYLGFLIYALFLIAVVVSLRNKKFLPYAAFFATWFFTAEFLICKVQLIDRQHNYTMILPFAFLFIMLRAIVLSKRKKLGAALICILAFNFIQPYFPSLDLIGLFHGKYQIPVRRDIDDIKKFVSDLNELTAGNERKVYVIADSALYNSNTLTKVYIPDVHDALPGFVSAGDIDLRDGFSTKFFDAHYIVVSEPLQIHMRPQDQSIIVKPYELMTTASPVSRHFKEIKEYTFSHDGTSAVKLKVYEKVSPFEKADIDFVEKIFVELYPTQDDLFKNRFEQYKREHFGE